MRATLVRDTEARGYRMRADRYITQGRVVSRNDVDKTVLLDVGCFLPDGTTQYLHNTFFQAQSPPQPGDLQTIHYTSSSPHSACVGSSTLGGSNVGQKVQNGGVTSLSKSGSAKLIDDVTLSAGANVTLTQSGQNIAIAASASGVGVAVEVSGGTETATEGVLNFIPGTNMDAPTAVVTGSDIDITLNASTQDGTGVIVEVSGGSEVGPKRVLNLIPGTGMDTITAAVNGTDIDVTLNVDQKLSANHQTGTSYTFVLADAGKVVEGDNASPITMTIPPISSVAWPVGTLIEIWQMGAGQITIAPGSGVTIRSDSGMTKTFGQYVAVGLRMRANDEWVLQGGLA